MDGVVLNYKTCLTLLKEMNRHLLLVPIYGKENCLKKHINFWLTIFFPHQTNKYCMRGNLKYLKFLYYSRCVRILPDLESNFARRSAYDAATSYRMISWLNLYYRMIQILKMINVWAQKCQDKRKLKLIFQRNLEIVYSQ